MKRELAFNNRPYYAFDMRTEYPGYTGEISYAIATDMSEEELTKEYGDEIEAYRPYILITMEMGEAMVLYYNNDAASHMRKFRGYEVPFEDYQGDFEGEEVLWDELLSELTESEIRKHLNHLKPKQARRVYKYLFENMSIKDIAREESRRCSTVCESVNRALKNLYKIIFDEEEVV